VDLLSKNGHHFTARFPTIAFVLRELPAKSAIIDAEIVASSGTGIPDFRKLHASAAAPEELCLWAPHQPGALRRSIPVDRPPYERAAQPLRLALRAHPKYPQATCTMTQRIAEAPSRLN
jgi:hypothetical protein